MLNIIKSLFRRDKPKHKNVFIGPSGFTADQPCSMCGRTPDLYEEFPIYGKPVCEECFWSDEFEEHQGIKRFHALGQVTAGERVFVTRVYNASKGMAIGSGLTFVIAESHPEFAVTPLGDGYGIALNSARDRPVSVKME